MDDFITPTEPVRAVAAERPTHVSLARMSLVGIAAAALIAVAILAFGWAAAPSSLLAAGTTGTSGPAAVDDLHGGRPGGPGFGDRMGGGVTITNISGSSISLRTADGWTRTITVDSGTTYSKGGATITFGDLKAGDQVAFRQTRESDGSYTIDSITVVLPHLGGEVTAVSGSTITVTEPDGTTGTIMVSGTTTYTVNGNGASLSDLKVGMRIVAEGTLNSDGSLAASNVHAGDMGPMRGPGEGRGFRGGFGPDNDGDGPNASASPSTTSSAS
jgi:hypothetical protein